MNQDPKNLILAIGLSLLVIIGWQYFYAGPQMEKQRQAQQQLQQPTPKPPSGAPTATPNAADPGAVPGAAPPPNVGIQPTSPEALRTREQALAESPRITLDTKSLSGSIPLKGGRIDDVVLKGTAKRLTPAVRISCFCRRPDPRNPIMPSGASCRSPDKMSSCRKATRSG